MNWLITALAGLVTAWLHGVRLPIVEMTLLHYKRLLAIAEQDEDISSLHRLKVAMFEGDES